MREKTAKKIRMMSYEGKSLRQISKEVDMNIEDIETYLLENGITPVDRVNRKAERENRKEAKSYMENQRVLGKPIEYKGKAAGKTPLTDEQKREILHMLDSGVSVQTIAKKFDRDKTLIYHNRDKWRAELVGEAVPAEETADEQKEPEQTEELPESEEPTANDEWSLEDDLYKYRCMVRMFGDDAKIVSVKAKKGSADITFSCGGEKYNFHIARCEE